MRALLALALLAPALAGCLDTGEPNADLTDATATHLLTLEEVEARLSQPIYAAIERTEATVEGADGVRTWLDVYLPADAEEKVPVILVMTPYQAIGDALAPSRCDPGLPQQCPYNPELVDFFVPRGYAVAFSDVRGNHNSGGCIDQSGPDQWQDGYNVVEWLAAQPWSNGKVGMYGASYDGETQISTALLNPPHLTTIVPTASVSNQYEYSYYDGVPYEGGAVGSMAAYLAISAVPGQDPEALPHYPERFTCQPENVRAALDLSGDWSAYWEDRDYRTLAPGINASVLQVHGLQDWNVKPNHVDGFWNELTTEKRLILGQWGHAYPDREDWQLIRHRWFDHWLKGIDTGILQDLPPVLVEDDTGDWHAIDSFPPLDADRLTLNLTADGELVAAPAEKGERTLRDVPRDVVNAQEVDPVVYAAHGESIQAAFQSEPFDQDVRLTGRPLLELVAKTSTESTHWVVHLIEVSDNGEEIVNRGYLDTRHRDGVDNPRPLEPGETYHATVRLFPQDTVIEKGHRLKVVITNDDGWVHQDTTNAANTLLFGADGTRLTLPVNVDGKPIPENKLRDGL